MTDYQIIFCTCPDAACAETLAHALLNAKLAACINIVPALRSLYYWQGKIETAEEHLLLIKAKQVCYSDIEQLIKAQHPFAIPEIIALPITAGLPDYLRWIEAYSMTTSSL